MEAVIDTIATGSLQYCGESTVCNNCDSTNLLFCMNKNSTNVCLNCVEELNYEGENIQNVIDQCKSLGEKCKKIIDQFIRIGNFK